MNILIIGTTDILGGAAKVSWDIKTRLEREKHEVSMFVADKRSSDPKVHVIPRQTWRKYLGFLFASESFISSDWILETDEFKRADIIHCHNLHGRYFNLETLAKISKMKPVVWTLHDEWALTPHCAYTFEGTKMENGLYVCPSIDTQPRILWNNSAHLAKWKSNVYSRSKLHIVTPSQWLKSRAEHTVLASHDIRLIPNGIDTSLFQKTDKSEARKKLGLPQEKRIILFLANDAKNNTWKGWKYTEEVIRQNRDEENTLFLSVGNLSEHADEPNVRYVGNIKEKSDLALYYSAADALLFTSIAENFPLVILEAMSCGLPIVAFDVGGVQEAVEHKKNGFIAKYLDTRGLLAGLEWLSDISDSEREAISKTSSEKIRACYDMNRMTGDYLSLYHELQRNTQPKEGTAPRG